MTFQTNTTWRNIGLCLGVILAICLVECLAASHGHHQTENTEQDSVQFYYDPDSHYFILNTRSHCYIAPLDKAESDHVHSSLGIVELEVTMMKDWLGKVQETRVFHDDLHFPTKVLSHCRGRDIYFLERNITSALGSTLNTPVSATSYAILG